jgi:hypothetical protein
MNRTTLHYKQNAVILEVPKLIERPILGKVHQTLL